MEMQLSTNAAARIPSLGELVSNAGNWTANLTQLASEIANYSLNLMDVGLVSTTLSTPTPTATLHAEAAHAIMSNITPTNTEPPIEDNAIRLTHAPQRNQSTMVQVYVLSLMAFLSLLGNVLTMWNIYKTRISRRKSRHSSSAIYSLIFHLSIADILVTGFCIIGEAAWRYSVKWLADELTCKLVKLFQMFSLNLSTYVLVLIGVDRWIAVKYPMKSLNMAKRCHRLLGGTYVLSLLLSLPQVFIFHLARGPFIEEFYQCVTHGFYTAIWQEQLYATFSLVFTFLLPLCILFGTYLSTFRTISSSEKIFQGSKLAAYSHNKTCSYTNRQRLIHKAKMKSLRISVVIIFAFLICWTPYYVMMMIFMYSEPDARLSNDLDSAIFFFGMSNSLVNPLIYGAFHLCPAKDKMSKGSSNNNGAQVLSRGDSQRTMLSAVTQFDGRSRQLRTYRQPTYYRSHSNSNGSSYKDHEQVGLLQVTSTPTILGRRTASVHSPHPNHCAQLSHLPPPTHATTLLGNGKAAHSTVVLSYDDHKGGVAALRANSSGSLSGMNGLNKSLAAGSAKNANLHSYSAANESVSSV